MILFLLGNAISCVDSYLHTYPGPVVVFRPTLIKQYNLNKGEYEEYSTRIVITCASSERITWDLPDLNFAEVADKKVICYS